MGIAYRTEVARICQLEQNLEAGVFPAQRFPADNNAEMPFAGAN
jgi:hypothetical protein